MTDGTQKSPLFRLLLLAVIIIAASGWAGLHFITGPQFATMPESSAITLLPSGRKLPALEMVNQDAQPFGRVDFAGHWSLVFMGFTNCGDVCPTTMAKVSMIYDGVDKPLSIVFVSVDPDRDTPEIIGKFVAAFNPDFIGITGAPEQIGKLATAFGTSYSVRRSDDSYTVNHLSALFLVDPSASVAGVITQPLKINTLIEELNRLLRG